MDDYDDVQYSSSSDMDDCIPASVLECTRCHSLACVRSCAVVLLADTDKSLYSSDAVLPSVLVQIETERKINTCACQVCDMSCRFCNLPLGYKVLTPCEECLSGDNNGHFHMFSSPHLEELYTRDLDDPRLEERASSSSSSSSSLSSSSNKVNQESSSVDELILYYYEGEFMTQPEDDLFHREEARRQREIIQYLEKKREMSMRSLLLLQSMAERDEGEQELGESEEGGEENMNGGGRSGEQKQLARIKEFIQLLDAITQCPLKDKRNEIMTHCRAVKKRSAEESAPFAWTKEIAVALGRMLKAYKSLQGVSESSEVAEDDEGLFWMMGASSLTLLN